jgi:hypothetical protein
MRRCILTLALVLVSACDVEEPVTSDDDTRVQIVDERVENERLIREVELFEPIDGDLVSEAREQYVSCVCTGCNGPCKPGGGACTECWTDEPPISTTCCETCFAGLPECPPLAD